MNELNFKGKIKKFWEDNKKTILLGSAVVGAVVAAYTLADDKDKNVESKVDEITKKEYENVYGKDCLITYSDEATGEVMWKERCTEYYVDQMKESGMEYEEVRKLNGLE